MIRRSKHLLIHGDSDIFLTNLSEDLAAKGIGTYRYMGTWEMIDQVIVSSSLLSSENGLFTSPNDVKSI